MPETIRFCTLASGSSGNAVYCESAEGAVLIDAGLSCRQLLLRMNGAGLRPERVDGILLTHHHSDHARGAGTASRGLQRPAQVPLFMTAGTARGVPRSIGKVPLRRFLPGERLCLGGFHIESLPTPHDADEPVALVLVRGRTRLGILTDLGHPFETLRTVLPTLDAVVLESNYDPELLRRNPRYPERLKRRIRGPHGHISNAEAAALVRDCAGARLRAILLAHLSENNNRPELALACHREVAAAFHERHAPILRVAPRYAPSDLLTVEPLPDTPARA